MGGSKPSGTKNATKNVNANAPTAGQQKLGKKSQVRIKKVQKEILKIQDQIKRTQGMIQDMQSIGDK